MKNFSKLFLCLFAVTVLGFAQTTVTSTTLNGAMAANATTVTLTSSTNVTAASTQTNTALFVDRDYMVVTTLVSGNTWNVRHVAPGISTGHLASAPIWVGPPGAFDLGVNDPTGSCASTSLVYLPRIMVRTGNLYNCDAATGKWGAFGTYASRQTLGALITAAATIAPVTNFAHITGATTITTITPPPALHAAGGCLTLIPDLAGATSSSGNIAIATTTVVSKALTLCYDVNAAKWYPSY